MGLSFNTTCNVTLEDLRIGESEEILAANMTFHSLGLIIAAACALIAVLISFYLIFMHATHYTKPYEQRHIIRILFMIPVYAIASVLTFRFYWHAVYFRVICDCYEAFAIASFFALLCHYIAPNLHEQKMYFRSIEPKGWVWPVSWLNKCCGGERGPWRTPRSGLTWFNIIWTGVYHYCFIRVSMTVTAVITQHFGKYCESSNLPVFAHIWILVIESVAVTIAMYCLIQFYIQLRLDLVPHSPFLKVLAIKLVIFLSFWQSFVISILTSTTVNVLKPTSKIAYPDLSVGIPSLLLCIEMALFAILHLFAFSWKPYASSSLVSDYPMSPLKNTHGPKQGGFLGLKALADAMNPWDLVKAFARGMRWLFVGVKKRKNDPSYKVGAFDVNSPQTESMSLHSTDPNGQNRAERRNLPIAEEFRRSLIAYAQPHPVGHNSPNPFQTFQQRSGYIPARQRYDINGKDVSSGGTVYNGAYHPPRPGGKSRSSSLVSGEDIGIAITDPPEIYQSHVVQPYLPKPRSETYRDELGEERRKLHPQPPSEQWANASRPAQPEVQNASWGQQGQQWPQNLNPHRDSDPQPF